MLRAVRFFLTLLVAVAATSALAAPPGEVSGVSWSDASTLTWSAEPAAEDYDVYRGLVADLAAGGEVRCVADEVTDTFLTEVDRPPPGHALLYLVSGESAEGEGTLGAGSSGEPRRPSGRCDDVVRQRVLGLLGFGPEPWTRQRLATLGPAGYVDEQLAPGTIDESDNAALNTRLEQLLPPDTLSALVQSHLVRAIYARRQLEEQVLLFWNNHFNTDWNETVDFLFIYYAPDLDPNFPERLFRNATDLHDRQLEEFRSLAFSGTFRDLVESSAAGPVMLIYLDTIENVAEAPNENYARELLELHTMGVDGGYTQTDVEELARVLTGWTVCKKVPADVGDPLAPCVDPFFGPPGEWTGHFDPNLHDPGQKILFAGTPQETIIPDTSTNPADGVNDLSLALDAIVAHPSTPRFIARKLLERLVDENPGEAQIDRVAEAWTASGGRLVDVYRAVLDLGELTDPRRAGGKTKTPFEHIASAYRALEASTSYLNLPLIEGYLYRLRYPMFRYPVPTGLPEVGRAWINTNALLDRQAFGIELATNFLYGADPAGLVSAAGAGTPEEIVDVLADRLLGGRLTAAQRSRAITFLTTDDQGNPRPDLPPAAINDTAAWLLGLGTFVEQ